MANHKDLNHQKNPQKYGKIIGRRHLKRIKFSKILAQGLRQKEEEEEDTNTSLT